LALEDAVELIDGLLLVPDIDQHGTCRECVDRRIRHRREIVGRGTDKRTSVCHLCLSRKRRRVVEQILRNVTENDPARWVSLKRTKGNEAVATADVEKGAASHN